MAPPLPLPSVQVMTTTPVTSSVTQRGSQDTGPKVRAVGVWPTVWLYLVVTCLAAGGLMLLQPVTHVPMEVLAITQFGPTIAVLVVLAARRGAALRAWQGTATATLRRIAVVFTLMAGVTGLSLAILSVTGRAIHLTSPGTLAEPFWLIALAQLIGACGEEFGWRSFLQPHLELRYSPVVSALIVGVMWGTWHVEYFSNGLPFMSVFLVMTMAISVILAKLIRRVSSLAVAGTFHWLLNLAVLLALNFGDGDRGALFALAGSLVVVAIVVWAHPRLWPGARQAQGVRALSGGPVRCGAPHSPHRREQITRNQPADRGWGSPTALLTRARE